MLAGHGRLLNAVSCIVGVPRDEEGWERLAAALYRGVLRALPASAMSWFGALRDRGLAADLEVPSPMLFQKGESCKPCSCKKA
jgi:hypothetical protein